MIIDHDLHLDRSREAEFFAKVGPDDDGDLPQSIYQALRRFSFETDYEDDGTFSIFEIDWMSGDGWGHEVFEAMAPFVRAGDTVHHRHIDGDDSEVTDTLVVFDGAGSWKEKVGRVVFD